MGYSKREFEKLAEEYPLGEEHRAYIHWMEQEQYERYPKKPNNGIFGETL